MVTLAGRKATAKHGCRPAGEKGPQLAHIHASFGPVTGGYLGRLARACSETGGGSSHARCSPTLDAPAVLWPVLKSRVPADTSCGSCGPAWSVSAAREQDELLACGAWRPDLVLAL